MTTFQLLLFILALVVFYLFFKQLLSGEHPKRGVDFEANLPDNQIGGINRPDKTFSRPQVQPNRMEQLLKLADDALEKEDFEEAKKALNAAEIVEEEHPEVIVRQGMLCLKQEKYEEAKTYYEKLIALDEKDDMAYGILANIVHKLQQSELALEYHTKAIEIDDTYAPHHFNYANTLLDLDKKEEALYAYEKAYSLDNSLDEAKEMIGKLKG
jgi:tetratricopeptide (TPR) repeat protein